jgi:hypothetical protein
MFQNLVTDPHCLHPPPQEEQTNLQAQEAQGNPVHHLAKIPGINVKKLYV